MSKGIDKTNRNTQYAVGSFTTIVGRGHRRGRIRRQHRLSRDRESTDSEEQSEEFSRSHVEVHHAAPIDYVTTVAKPDFSCQLIFWGRSLPTLQVSRHSVPGPAQAGDQVSAAADGSGGEGSRKEDSMNDAAENPARTGRSELIQPKIKHVADPRRGRLGPERRQAASAEQNNPSLLKLPPYRPELNPVEDIWEFLRANQLSNRVFDTTRQSLTPAATPGTPSSQTQNASAPLPNANGTGHNLTPFL